MNIAFRPLRKRVKLGDVLTLINGRAYKQNELLDDGTPIIRIQNLNGGDRWYYSDLRLPPNKYCEEGDLLFAWSATFGPYFWRGQKAIYHYHIWKILCSDALDKKYAYYLLASITERVKASGRGISMIHMTKEGMENWVVEIPPLDEQRRIAAILDKADALRRKRKRALDLLDSLTQSIFQEMFGGSVANVVERKPLSALTTEIYRYPTYYGIEYVEAGVPEIRGELIKDDGSVVDDEAELRFISEDTSRRFPKTILSAGDLVMSVRGTIGKIGQIPASLDGANITANLIRIAPDREQVDPMFLNHAMRSEDTLNALKSISSSTTIATIKASDLRSLKIPCPSLEVQRRFSSLVEQQQAALQLASQGATNSDALFSALRSRAFSDQL